MSNKIYLKNMVFYGFHGVYEYERELGQRFYVDLEVDIDFTKVSQTDQLQDTVDYVAMYHKTKDLVENTRFQVLESLICKIGEEVLHLCPLIKQVKVNIRKPSVPITGALDCVELEIVRSR